MGSMHTGLEDRARDTDRLAAYFAERARGGVGLIITGGYAPNRTGWLLPFASQMVSSSDARRHRRITDAVHDEGGKILLQILHAGRYAYHPFSVSASAIKAPINPFRPRALRNVDGTDRRLRALRRAGPRRRLRRCRDHGQRRLSAQPVPGAAHQQAHRRLGRFAREAATVPGRDRPPDPRGGRVGLHHLLPDVDGRLCGGRPELGRDRRAGNRSRGGRRDDDQLRLRLARGAGADDRHLGTHARSSISAARSAEHVDIPVVASNRINMPQAAEEILAETHVQMISMARPLLSDPDWVHKAQADAADEINTCISCNQACLDHAFVHKKVSCLLNPRAGRETDLVLSPTRRTRHIAVVGAGRPGWPRR